MRLNGHIQTQNLPHLYNITPTLSIFFYCEPGRNPQDVVIFMAEKYVPTCNIDTILCISYLVQNIHNSIHLCKNQRENVLKAPFPESIGLLFESVRGKRHEM